MNNTPIIFQLIKRGLSITILLFFFATPVLANKIDELKTDEDVERFIHKQNRKLKDFYITSIEILYYDTLQQKIADSLGVKPWQKADFDNNGLSDLLVYGSWDGNKCLIAIIDDGNKFVFRFLSRGFFDDVYFPAVTTINKQPFLILNKSCDFCSDIGKQIISTDTLIYKFGDFIEPNFNTPSYKIEKIEFSTTMCFGTCPVFELEIKSDRTAKYHAIQYNNETGKFKTIIDPANFELIISLLNYIDFPNLKDDYNVNWTDDQTCILTITYDNGKKKIISDYGKLGTHGLSMIYSKLFKLRENQKWR